MSDDKAGGGFTIPSWFWWVGAGLAASVVVLMVLWYVKHPDRSVFQDFAPRRDLGAPQANGHFPAPASTAGSYSGPRPEAGETI